MQNFRHLFKNEFSGSKSNDYKNLKWPFCRVLNCTFCSVLCLRYIKPFYFRGSRLFTGFWPKCQIMTSQNVIFSKKNLHSFFWTFDGRRELMPVNVLEVSRPYPPSLLSYWENPGGDESPPTPAGRVLKPFQPAWTIGGLWDRGRRWQRSWGK